MIHNFGSHYFLPRRIISFFVSLKAYLLLPQKIPVAVFLLLLSFRGFLSLFYLFLIFWYRHYADPASHSSSYLSSLLCFLPSHDPERKPCSVLDIFNWMYRNIKTAVSNHLYIRVQWSRYKCRFIAFSYTDIYIYTYWYLYVLTTVCT